jgi:hypothetical protein
VTTRGGSDPEQPADEILELVARCLERIDETHEAPLSVLDALCREHPEHADALRARLAHLERAGLASGRPPGGGSRTLGRFELQGELGRGGMGVVYLAYDPRLGRRVALKALGPRLAVSDRARARFEREVRAIAALHHPRIVPVYEVGEEAGIPYYTMELIEGRTLAQVIQPPRPPPPPRPPRPCRPSGARPTSRPCAGSCTTWPRRSSTPTPTASCTATSSPRTCCSTGAAAPCSSTSGWRAWRTTRR